MRIDLEGYDYDIVYIVGKENVAADALSRITTTSEDLKTNILLINTRSMTKKSIIAKTKEEDENVHQKREIDHLTVYESESPTEIKKNV